jgi:hypothetical protein
LYDGAEALSPCPESSRGNLVIDLDVQHQRQRVGRLEAAGGVDSGDERLRLNRRIRVGVTEMVGTAYNTSSWTDENQQKQQTTISISHLL